MSETKRTWTIEKVTQLITDLLKKKHGNARIYYGTSSTATATQRKDVNISECTALTTGDIFIITFTYSQTYNGAPTMQINSFGAKNIRRITGTNAGRYEWSNGETIIFVWNGSYFLILNGAFATTTYYGRTKLYTGADSAGTSLALTPAAMYNMANCSICPYYSTSATYAVGDKVRWGNYIYECITAIPTAEAWTAAHWHVVPTLQEQIDDVKASLYTVATHHISRAIPVSSWTLNNGMYYTTITDSNVISSMVVAEAWADNEDVLTCSVFRGEVNNGSITLYMDSIPNGTLNLHIFLVANGTMGGSGTGQTSITIGNTMLNETQLQSLIALLDMQNASGHSF